MDTSSLMEQILSKDNLNTAYLQVVRNKGAEGVDGMKYTELKEHLAKNGEIIKEQLRTRKYKPQPVHRVEISKPDGGVRNLGVPTVTDRFVQQAIAQVLTPIYEKQFHDHSYGFRPNRCAQQAIITALDMMNDGYDWIVDIDLEKFFDTVNHDKLMTLIGKTIKDGDVISIIRKFLVSGIMVDDEYRESVIGTPQGGNLSPLLANIILNELDKEMEQRGLNFVRYADDCIIMVGSEMSARRVMRNLTKFIEEKLGLKVNMTKSKVDRPRGLKYLPGYVFDTEDPRNKKLEKEVKNDSSSDTITLNLYYKPTVLKVSKTVTGYNMEPHRSYEFTIKAVPPSGTDASTATITDGQIFIRKGTDDKVQNLTFTNNKATFNLAKDEFVDISCLPTGWTYTVTETDPGKNYKTSYKLNDSDATDGRAAEFKTSTTGNDEVTFTNASTVAPPETGRTIHDSEWILLLIVILVISAGGMTFLRKMKKRY